MSDAPVEYAWVGGYAIAAHGIRRLSEDIDLLVNPVAYNSHRWIVALSHLPEKAALVLATEPDAFVDGRRYAVRINDEFTIDIMPSVGGRSWEEMSSYVETVDLEGTPLRVLSLEGLPLTKQGMRPKDPMDAAVIQHALCFLKKQGKK